MLLSYQFFYRKYGIRLLQQLIAPVMQDTQIFALPVNSIYHYCNYDSTQDGPSNEELFFKGNIKPIPISHITELSSDVGFPKKTPLTTANNIRDYHRVNRRTRFMKTFDGVQRDPTTLITYNYSILSKVYRYTRSFYTEYHKWYNIFSTICVQIAHTTETNDRQHFIPTGSPGVIPSISQFNLASKGMNQSLLKVFRDKNSYLLLEIWKFLNEDPEVAKTSLLSKIPISKIHLVNFVYVEDNRWVVLNLGHLHSFSKHPEDESIIRYKQAIEYTQLQKRLLKFTMSVMEVRTLAAAIDNNVNIETTRLEDKEQQDNLEKDISEIKPMTQTPILDTLDDNDDLDSETDEQREQRIKDEDDLLDQELAQLNEIAKKQESDGHRAVQSLKELLENNAEVPLEKEIMIVCDSLADKGLLSAGEYKRLNAISTAYKELKAPNGQPMHEFCKIDPESLKITESKSVVDKDTVLDKSMLKSSLLEFDSNYIENILPKDTFNMVLNVHRAGIAVTDYKVERTEDILGGFETHVIKLNPIIGKSSTIRFKLPIINKDGVYKSSLIKYRIRKQRTDLPIRKIDPQTVALTSYFGKMFVSRSEKKTDDYGYWLVSEITAKALIKENPSIKGLMNADVFDKTFKCPRAYSAISMQIKSFICKGYTFNFNSNIRQELYSQESISKYEKQGSVIVAIDKDNNYLVMDRNNTLYTTKGSTLEVLSSIEDFLDLDRSNSPVEYVEASVFGKQIPVGIILSYFIGFERLLSTLKVNYRRAPAHSRLNLEPTEWTIAFSDETLIFNREDRYSSLILAGINNYHKAVKQFSVYSFDKSGVYLNLLEASGLGARYLRELDLINKMFIDPITRGILVDMNEPTTMQGLFLRSCELLLSDNHPEGLDPKFMRIRGYERISGAVYTELVNSIRMHDGRLGKSNVPIELNPFAVWRRIAEDPSKSIVNEQNPIESLKEMEAVTYSGTGGRNRRSMVQSTRSYHKNDMGTISESTVDSSDVSINVFTSADPQFDSLRGTSKRYKPNKSGVTSLISTSALLAPGGDRDDMKRVKNVELI